MHDFSHSGDDVKILLREVFFAQSMPFKLASPQAAWLSIFCLRPLAKDQGITRVVVVLLVLLVLHLLVYFLIKRNLREKISPSRYSNLGPPDPQSGTLPTELRRHFCLSVRKLSTNFKNHTLDQYWSTLVL